MKKYRSGILALIAAFAVMLSGCNEQTENTPPSLSFSQTSSQSAPVSQSSQSSSKFSSSDVSENESSTVPESSLNSSSVPSGPSSSSSKDTPSSSSSKVTPSSSSSKVTPSSSSSKVTPSSSSSKVTPSSSSSKVTPSSSSSKVTPSSSSSKVTPSSSSSKTTPSSSQTPSEAVDPKTCKHNIVIDQGRIPEFDAEGLTQGAHCSICNTVFNKQYEMQKLFNYKLKSITQPTATSKGTAVYTDKTAGDCTITFDSIPTEQSVYETLISFKEKYPEKTPFTNEGNQYISTTLFPRATYRGDGCVAFAFELSDAAFGDFPGRYSFDFANVKVGDIIRLNENKHSVIVLKVEGDTVTIAEGNYNKSVHWERTLNLSDAAKEWNYIITRYPPV